MKNNDLLYTHLSQQLNIPFDNAKITYQQLCYYNYCSEKTYNYRQLQAQKIIEFVDLYTLLMQPTIIDKTQLINECNQNNGKMIELFDILSSNQDITDADKINASNIMTVIMYMPEEYAPKEGDKMVNYLIWGTTDAKQPTTKDLNKCQTEYDNMILNNYKNQKIQELVSIYEKYKRNIIVELNYNGTINSFNAGKIDNLYAMINSIYASKSKEVDCCIFGFNYIIEFKDYTILKTKFLDIFIDKTTADAINLYFQMNRSDKTKQIKLATTMQEVDNIDLMPEQYTFKILQEDIATII